MCSRKASSSRSTCGTCRGTDKWHEHKLTLNNMGIVKIVVGSQRIYLLRNPSPLIPLWLLCIWICSNGVTFSNVCIGSNNDDDDDDDDDVAEGQVRNMCYIYHGKNNVLSERVVMIPSINNVLLQHAQVDCFVPAQWRKNKNVHFLSWKTIQTSTKYLPYSIPTFLNYN